MDIYRLLIELAAGAFTGYTTNSLAINMLFKNYGPFGGVIIKTKDEFTENISQLVEKDILKEKALLESINQPEIKESIRKMITYFINNSLQGHTNLAIIEIPEFDNSLKNLIYFISEKGPIYFQNLPQIFLSEIKLKQLLSTEHFNYICQQFLRESLRVVNDFPESKEFFSNILSEINNKGVNDFLNPDIRKVLNNYFEYLSSEIANNPDYLYKKITTLLNTLKEDLDIDKLIKEMLDQSKNKRLKDYQLNQEYLLNLKNNLLEILDSKQGQNTINDIYINFLNSIRKNNLLLQDFINDKTGEKLNLLIQKKTKLELNLINDWLEINKNKLNDIFDKIFIKTIDKESLNSPWKSAIKKSAYNLLRKNSSTTPSSILVGLINNQLESNTGQNLLSEQILKHIHNIKLQSITKNLDNYNKDKFIADLNNKINKNFLLQISEYNISKLLNLEKINPDLIRLVNKNKDIEKHLLELLLSGLKKNINNLLHRKLSILERPEDKTIFYNMIINKLAARQGMFKFFLERNIYKKIEDKRLLDFIDILDSIDYIRPYKKYISINLYQQISEKSKINLSLIINNLLKKQDNISKLSQIFIKELNNKLPTFLKGNISAAIKANLRKISDNDVKNIINDFIGRELKPITYFGALLGTLTASLLYLLQTSIPQLSSIKLPFSFLIYGFIGYITNVIAIKMIFRPYTEKDIFGITLPFTPGVVTKEKERFADSVGNFIDKELLNQGTVKNIIQEKRGTIFDILKESLLADNYQIIRKLLEKNVDNLSIYISTYLKNKKPYFLDKFIDTIRKPEFLKDKGDAINSFANNTAGYLERYIYSNIPVLASYLFNIIKEADKITDIIPEFARDNINEHISSLVEEKTDFYVKLLQDSQKNNEIENRLARIIIDFSQKYKNKTLKDIPVEIRELIIETVYNFSKTIINRNNNFIKEIINSMITEEIESLLASLPKLLEENKTEIKSLIVNEAKTRMGFWSKAGSLVDFDETLDKFTETFIKEGIPEILELFLKENKEILIENFLIQENELKGIISGIYENSRFRKLLEENINFILDKLSTITLSELFIFLEIKKATDLINPFSQEIKFISRQVAERFKNNHEKIKIDIDYLMKEIMDRYLYNRDTDIILKNINEEIIEKLIRQIYQELNIKNGLNNLFSRIIEDIISANISDNRIINSTYLKKDLNSLYDSLFANPEVIGDLHSLLNEILLKLCSQLPEIIERETAESLIDLLIEAILETLEIYLPDLVREIDIKDITVEEINNMKAVEIEKLFYSFAGNYFSKLEHYGWFGSIIGLISEMFKHYL